MTDEALVVIPRFTQTASVPGELPGVANSGILKASLYKATCFVVSMSLSIILDKLI